MENISIRYTDTLKDDTIIWRYFDFPSFISLLLCRKLVFRRFDDFEDLLEGTTPLSAKKDYYKFLVSKTDIYDAKMRSEKEAELIERYKKWAYANCWTMDNNENFAFWKIYLKNQKEGVAIRTTVKELADCINYNPAIIKNNEAIIIKEVNYKEIKYFETNQETVYTTKYPPYKYESELRLFFKNQLSHKDREKGKEIYKGYNETKEKYIEVETSKLIKNIWISPFAGEWFKHCVQKLLTDKFPEIKAEIHSSIIKT